MNKVVDGKLTNTCDDDGEDPTPTPEETPLAFGDTFTYEDGLSVTASTPQPFVRPRYAAGGGRYPHHVKMTVRVVNNTGKNFDLSLATAEVQSGNRAGDEIYAMDQGLGGPPMMGPLLDGREVEYDMGFGVDNPNDLVLSYSPSWDYEPAIYATNR